MFYHLFWYPVCSLYHQCTNCSFICPSVQCVLSSVLVSCQFSLSSVYQLFFHLSQCSMCFTICSGILSVLSVISVPIVLSSVLVFNVFYHLFWYPVCSFCHRCTNCSFICPGVQSLLSSVLVSRLLSLSSVPVSPLVYYLSWCPSNLSLPSALVPYWSIIYRAFPSIQSSVLLSPPLYQLFRYPIIMVFAPFVLTFTMTSLMPS